MSNFTRFRRFDFLRVNSPVAESTSCSCPEEDDKMPDLLLTFPIIPFAGGFESTSAEAGALFMSALRSNDDVEFASTEAAPIVDAGFPRLSTFDSGRLPSDFDPASSWPEGTCKPLACGCCCCCSCCSCSGLWSESPPFSSSSVGIEDAVTKVLELDRRKVRPWGSRSESSSSGSEGASTNSSYSASSMTSLFWSEARGTCKAGGVAAVASAAPLAPLASDSCAPSSSSSASSSSGWGKLCWKRAEELGPSRPLSRRWRASRGSEEKVAVRVE